MTLHNTASTLSDSQFSGEIILPADSNYVQASTTFYRFQGTPDIVVRPRTTQDVATAVKYARSNNLDIAVRSGGHNAAGYGTIGSGMLVDLSAMHAIKVLDSQQRTVRIGSGATWGDVAAHLQKHDLVLSSGDTKSVGVGGLTLGGGIGWMVRKHGLTIDSLKAAEIVTASGDILRASATENSDLFWAIRGGGGNFGIVTSFEFTAHPLEKIHAGTITYPAENIPALLRGWRDHMRRAPDELSTTCYLMPRFGDNPAAVLVQCCYVGDDQAAKQAIDPLLRLGTIISNDIAAMAYADFLEDSPMPEGIKVIVNSMFVRKLENRVTQDIANTYTEHNTPMQIRSLGGAMSRIHPDATAFAHRQSEVFISSPTFVSPNATPEEITAATTPWEKLSAHGDGPYINFLSQADPDAIKAAYPARTLQRLMRIKAHYDPLNTFARNVNIPPAA